jgi:hypothetical protein
MKEDKKVFAETTCLEYRIYDLFVRGDRQFILSCCDIKFCNFQQKP